MLFHHSCRDFVVLQIVIDLPASFTFRDNGRIRPDQHRVRFPESRNEDVEVDFVLLQRCRQSAATFVTTTLLFGFRMTIAQIPQSPVKVDHVPLRIAQPAFQFLDSGARMLSIAFVMRDIRFVLHHLHNVRRVTQRD